MSHFTVLVVGDDVEAALAPFQENNMGDCPAQYMEFNDREDEYKLEYETKSREMVVMPDGSYVCPYDRKFAVKGQRGAGVPPELERRQVPFKELYASFDEMAEDWHGSKRDEKTGRFGYWDNPNKKWDWYQIGGRWSGSLKLKPGADGAMGERSWGDKEPLPDNMVDQARAGDIDWDAMIAEASEKAGDRYDKVITALAGDVVIPWRDFLAQVEQNQTTIDVARDTYHAQQGMVAVRAALPDSWSVGEIIEDVTTSKDRDDYVSYMGKRNARQYAILSDGQWHEPGQMGWFGLSTRTTESDREYTEKYWQIVRGLPDNVLVTVVDCHI